MIEHQSDSQPSLKDQISNLGPTNQIKFEIFT
jgi:hypothetical protein